MKQKHIKAVSEKQAKRNALLAKIAMTSDGLCEKCPDHCNAMSDML